jgi:hypothetical protein
MKTQREDEAMQEAEPDGGTPAASVKRGREKDESGGDGDGDKHLGMMENGLNVSPARSKRPRTTQGKVHEQAP